MNSSLGDMIAKLCFEKYNNLGKSGKPQEKREWTLLSGFVIQIEDEFRVVSLATGTKCIGANSMCSEGLIVNDSHAEVLARRAFLRFLYEDVKTCLCEGSSSIFNLFGNKCRMKRGVWIHIYISQVPCGDASIIPMKDEIESPRKRQRVDVYRTGAKPLFWEARQDLREPGPDYHIRGAVRVKPGRGDPTLSLSCSDKIAKWIYVGLQGGLLSHIIEEPVRLKSVVIGGGGPFDEEVIYDALISRSKAKSSVPKIVHSKLVFKHAQCNVFNGKPAATSIIWADVKDKPLEISVEGRRLGTTSKTRDRGRLKICKRELLHSFLSLNYEGLNEYTYREIKDKAVYYKILSNDFKSNMGSWSKKPAYENFAEEYRI